MPYTFGAVTLPQGAFETYNITKRAADELARVLTQYGIDWESIEANVAEGYVLLKITKEVGGIPPTILGIPVRIGSKVVSTR